MTHHDPLAHVPVFPERRKGYDPETVDQYLHALQIQLTEANTRLADSEDRVRAAILQGPDTNETESAATLQAAKQTADRAIAEARERATRTLAEARTRAEAMVTEARTRLEHAQRVHDKIETMKSDTATYVATAEQRLQAMRHTTNDETAELKDRATEDAREIRDSADSEARILLEEAHKDSDQLKAEARIQLESAKEAIREAEDRIIVTAKQQAAELISDATTQADQIRQTAQESADELADRLTATANEEADAIRRQANQESAEMTEESTRQAIEAAQSSERTISDAHEQADQILSEATASAEHQRRQAEMLAAAAEDARGETEYLRQEILRLSGEHATVQDNLDALMTTMTEHRAQIQRSATSLQLVVNECLAPTTETIDLSEPEPVETDILSEILDNAR